jgi:hypothetical protein
LKEDGIDTGQVIHVAGFNNLGFDAFSQWNSAAAERITLIGKCQLGTLPS